MSVTDCVKSNNSDVVFECGDGKVQAKVGGSFVVVNVASDPGGNGREATKPSLVAIPQPLKLAVETSTDWAIVAVGVASLITSLIVARFASKLQSTQIKANIANMRQNWVDVVRETAVEFSERAVFLVNHVRDDANYFDTKDSVTPYSELVSASEKLSIMLDMQHERNRRIDTVMDMIVDSVKSHAPGNRHEQMLPGYLVEFKMLVRDVLEDAWGDIKKDLLAQKGTWRFGKWNQ